LEETFYYDVFPKQEIPWDIFLAFNRIFDSFDEDLGCKNTALK
jgi:hypothetical protein